MFGDDTCYYSLTFGVPAIFMLNPTLIIIIGKPLYKMAPPQGNILIRVFGAIVRALKKMVDGKHTEHWMDLGMSFSCLKMSSVCSGTSCLLRSLQPRMASSEEEVGELRERSRTRRSLVELKDFYDNKHKGN